MMFCDLVNCEKLLISDTVVKVMNSETMLLFKDHLKDVKDLDMSIPVILKNINSTQSYFEAIIGHVN